MEEAEQPVHLIQHVAVGDDGLMEEEKSVRMTDSLTMMGREAGCIAAGAP